MRYRPGGTVLLYLLLSLWAPLVEASADRPNIIVFFSDDHGYSDLSCQGIVEDVRTPNIDRLAQNGVRMSSGYVTAPQCVPSRAGLLSGRYQNRFGVESNGKNLSGFAEQETIAERLQKAGYATGMTGKWHLGPQNEIVQHGFTDVFYKNSNRPGWANFNLDGTDRRPGPEQSGLYHLDANSHAACAFIRRHHDRPFFFYCAYRAPHVPLDAPARYLRRFPGEMPERRRQALAMISAIDDGVGKVISTLRELELEEKTLIFFIGDNGAPLKIHRLDAPGGGPGWDGSINDPLNGEKGMLSEGGIRVPFVVSWKGTIPGGRIYRHPVISLDVAATAVALAGLPPDPLLDGVNLLPYLRDRSDDLPHDFLYWRWIAQSAIREGRWKLLRGGQRRYLFDLDMDPEEKFDRAADYPEIVIRLERKLQDWASQQSPPGLATGSMSVVWERYFDHYLDGKPATRPNVSESRSTGNGAVQGWLARNATLEKTRGLLRVRSKSSVKRNPFLANNSIRLASKVRVTVRLRTSAGTGGISWREKDQRDFPPDQVARFTCRESDSVQECSAMIEADDTIIHLRLLLPGQSSDVASIVVTDAEGNTLKEWDFSQ